MTSGAQTQDSQFIEVGWRLPRCSHQFQSLLLPLGHFLQLPGVLGDEMTSGCLYLVTKPSHMGVDMDGLDYPLH
jgi:hypothetical protein